jgi:long-chain acyl-CoA synthetase
VMTALERRDDDLALLLYTSGTTGRPKGVMTTHGNLGVIRDAARIMLRMPPYLPTLHALPLSHGFGVLMMQFAYEHGWVAVMLPRWDTERVFEAIHSHRIARLSAVPTMLRYMLDFPDRARYDTSSLERVWLGGAPLADELKREFEAAFRCEVHNGYAQSEATGIATACWDGDRLRPGSAGRAVAGVDVRVLDAQARPLPAGEIGEICIRGPNLMTGYWRDEEATRRVLFGGWLHTEDLGSMDADGFLYVTGRKKDLIIKGGENIAPREIEEALLQCPAIGEVAVVGVPDPVFGEDIWAAATLKPGARATEEELRAHVRERLTKFKVPTRIVLVPELPKNSIGKVLKREIRSELARICAASPDRGR